MKGSKKDRGEADFTHDTGFKDLVQDYPEETVRWLTPEAEEIYGVIEEIVFIREEMKHQTLSHSGRILDIPMLIKFKSGSAVISLIEHKSDKASFSIFKVAHYTLDLAEAYPGVPIIPILVFADGAKWRKDVPREIKLEVLGKIWLFFTYQRVKLKEMEAAQSLAGDNPVLHILSPLMDYPKSDRLKVARDAYLRLRQHTGESLFLKYMDFIDKYAKIRGDEKVDLLNLLNDYEEGIMLREALLEEGEARGVKIGEERGVKIGEERGVKIGEARGIQKGMKLVAKNLLDSGMRISLIAEHTGLSTEEIMNLKTSNN